MRRRQREQQVILQNQKNLNAIKFTKLEAKIQTIKSVVIEPVKKADLVQFSDANTKKTGDFNKEEPPNIDSSKLLVTGDTFKKQVAAVDKIENLKTTPLDEVSSIYHVNMAGDPANGVSSVQKHHHANDTFIIENNINASNNDSHILVQNKTPIKKADAPSAIQTEVSILKKKKSDDTLPTSIQNKQAVSDTNIQKLPESNASLMVMPKIDSLPILQTEMGMGNPLIIDQVTQNTIGLEKQMILDPKPLEVPNSILIENPAVKNDNPAKSDSFAITRISGKTPKELLLETKLDELFITVFNLKGAMKNITDVQEPVLEDTISNTAASIKGLMTKLDKFKDAKPDVLPAIVVPEPNNYRPVLQPVSINASNISFQNNSSITTSDAILSGCKAVPANNTSAAFNFSQTQNSPEDGVGVGSLMEFSKSLKTNAKENLAAITIQAFYKRQQSRKRLGKNSSKSRTINGGDVYSFIKKTLGSSSKRGALNQRQETINLTTSPAFAELDHKQISATLVDQIPMLHETKALETQAKSIFRMFAEKMISPGTREQHKKIGQEVAQPEFTDFDTKDQKILQLDPLLSSHSDKPSMAFAGQQESVLNQSHSDSFASQTSQIEKRDLISQKLDADLGKAFPDSSAMARVFEDVPQTEDVIQRLKDTSKDNVADSLISRPSKKQLNRDGGTLTNVAQVRTMMDDGAILFEKLPSSYDISDDFSSETNPHAFPITTNNLENPKMSDFHEIGQHDTIKVGPALSADLYSESFESESCDQKSPKSPPLRQYPKSSIDASPYLQKQYYEKKSTRLAPVVLGQRYALF